MATIKDGKGTFALAAFDKSADLKKNEIGRPAPGKNDVALDIKFCGMCHSDLHACNGDWGIESFPISPGHEIAGVVSAVGSDVTEYKVGDRVAVGCFVDSCKDCDLCNEGLEQHCPKVVQTYSSTYESDDMPAAKGYHTNGGYTTAITVNKRFVFAVPDGMDLEVAGPLMCAGITMYSPLNRHVKGQGKKSVGVLGFGGLGHMGVKLAVAMGADVTVLSRNLNKKEAAEKLGAKILAHGDAEAVKAAFRTFDVILDTVSVPHDINSLLSTLKVGGALVTIGGVSKPFEVSAFGLLMNRHKVEGSLVGGVPETAEMLSFCAEHNIKPDFEVIHAKDADAQFKSLEAGTAGPIRRVIDISTIQEL